MALAGDKRADDNILGKHDGVCWLLSPISPRPPLSRPAPLPPSPSGTGLRDPRSHDDRRHRERLTHAEWFFRLTIPLNSWAIAVSSSANGRFQRAFPMPSYSLQMR